MKRKKVKNSSIQKLKTIISIQYGVPEERVQVEFVGVGYIVSIVPVKKLCNIDLCAIVDKYI